VGGGRHACWLLAAVVVGTVEEEHVVPLRVEEAAARCAMALDISIRCFCFPLATSSSRSKS
jgi:hypothetical protein